MTYTPNQVLIDSSNTTVPASITLEQSGIYELRLVGGGGGGHYYFYMNDNFTNYGTYYASGGSGSAFWGQVYLEAGTYTVQLGTGGSAGAEVTSGTSGGNSIFGSCVAYGGTAGYINGNTKTPPSSVVAGSGGSTPSIVGCEIISIEMFEDGNNGRTGGGAGDQSQTKVYGGSSVYDSEIGAGGGFNGNAEGAGYDGLIYLKFVTAPEENESGSGSSDSESQEGSSTFTKKDLGEMATIVNSYYKYTNANVNIVGSLTDTNGVLSGFSTSNYTQIPYAFPQSSNIWEFVTKIHTPNYMGVFNDIAGISNKIAIGLDNTTNKFTLAVNWSGSAWEVNAFSSIVTTSNTDYWIKVNFTGTQYILSYSTDGTNYTQDIVLNSTTQVSGIFNIGLYISDTSYFQGSIDLKESYIKINGNIWWNGMQVEKGTSEDYDFYTESYSYKTYSKEETYTESVYGDDIWSLANEGPSASSTEMVCYCKNSIYVYGVSNSKNYLNYLSSSEDIATGMWTKTIRNSLTMYNPCCVDGNYVYCANSTKDGIVYGSTNATSMSAIETDFDFSSYTIGFLKARNIGGSLVCGFTSSSDPLTQYLMKGEFTLDGGITWDSSYKEPVSGLKGLNHGNGKYVAIANLGDSQLYMLHATDSSYHLSWTTRPLLGQFHTATIVGAEYLNGVYYFLHSDGMISCSDDGITWKIKGPISNSLTSNWDGLAIFGSNLVAINRSGDIMYVNPSTPETVEKTVYHYGGYYNPIINLPKQY